MWIYFTREKINKIIGRFFGVFIIAWTTFKNAWSNILFFLNIWWKENHIPTKLVHSRSSTKGFENITMTIDIVENLSNCPLQELWSFWD
jgi:hypothetical protein